VISTGDVTADGPVSETIVWYGGPPPPANANWRSPSLAAAESVLDQLAGPAILGYDPHEVSPGATVTIQTGSALSVLPLATTTTTGTHSATTSKKHSSPSTTTTSPVTTTTTEPLGMQGNPDFTAPSAVNQALQPWDPRACNAAGTGPAT
jgi:hypothetical protein